MTRARAIEPDLLERIRRVVAPGVTIETLSVKRPNRIAFIEGYGIGVETERSTAHRAEPQLVPAWMVQTAWDHLRHHGSLEQNYLLNQLNVKRSAFVVALLAQFPDVAVRSTRPTVLELLGT